MAGNWQEWLFVGGYVGFFVAIAVIVLTNRSES